MECFVHAAQPGVAICKSCGRATCRECARDLGHAIVCRAECEVEAAQMHEMNERALRIYGIGSTRRRAPLVPLMWAGFALLFGGYGAFIYFARGDLQWFPLLFGLLTSVMAVATWRRAKELEINC